MDHNFNTFVFCLIFTGKQTFQSILLSFAWYLEANGPLFSYFCLVIRTFKSFSNTIAWYLIWRLKNQSKTRNTMPKLGIRYYLIRSDKIVQSWIYKTADYHSLIFRSKWTPILILLSSVWYLLANGHLNLYFCLLLDIFHASAG